MRYIIALLSVFIFTAASAESLTVGVKQSPPFAIKEGAYWSGDSIDIVEGIAADLDQTITYKQYNTVDELLSAVQSGDVDMAISAITITAAREANIDFSYPYMSSNLAILTRSNGTFISTAVAIGGKVLGVMLGLIALLYLVGFVADRIDGDGTIHNPHEGAWWALVTFSTTGYGDLVPETGRGKVLAAAWIVLSLFLVSLFTGYVSSSMTVERLSSTPTTLSDLHDSSVITLSNTTSEAFLEESGVQHFSAKTLEEALASFYNGKVDAVVYDMALLEYSAGDGDYEIWPIGQHTEYYGIALPEESELKEVVDISILNQTQ
jgi:ABC-type amino acid transport substrate-binding protein